MPLITPFRSVLLVSISALALGACSGSSGTGQAKSSAPMPPITEMDAAMNAPAPQPLSESDTLTPVMPRAIAGTGGEAMEERIARLEQSVNAMQGDYQKIMPAFASLNTTNERIQKLLNQIERETGKKVALTDAPAPVAAAAPLTTVTTTKTVAAPATPIVTVTSAPAKEAVPATGVTPAAGTVSRANAEPVKTVTEQTTTVTTDTVVHSDAATTGAPPLSAFKEQPTAEEARAEAARQTGKAATATQASAALSSGGENAVTGVRIGEHGTKTRLVFDLDGKTKPAFKYDLDNGEHLLLVEMPSSAWTGKSSGTPKSPLVAGWTASAGTSGGSSVAIQLKKDARVLSTEFLKAEGKDPARLVVDIAPQG